MPDQEDIARAEADRRYQQVQDAGATICPGIVWSMSREANWGEVGRVCCNAYLTRDPDRNALDLSLGFTIEYDSPSAAWACSFWSDDFRSLTKHQTAHDALAAFIPKLREHWTKLRNASARVLRATTPAPDLTP